MQKAVLTVLVMTAAGFAWLSSRKDQPADAGTMYSPSWPQFNNFLTWEPPYTMSNETQAQKNLNAFLAMIKWAEGTAQYSDPYSVLFGGESFSSFADHPRRVVCRMMGSGEICSSAAGAYQILQKTWDWIASDLPDFSPQSQDEAAKRLIKYRGALPDVEAGYFDMAISKVSKEWASMPQAGYGQPEKKLTDLKQVYINQGGMVA